MPADPVPDDTSSRLRAVVFRCSVALLSVVVGLWVAGLLIDLLDATTVLLGAVVVAAWFGGMTSGIVASVLATLGIDYYFSFPLYTITPEVSHLPRMAVFGLLAASFSAASVGRKSAERSLQKAHDEMEVRVRARTAELVQTNERLQAEIAERRRAEEALEDLAGRLIHAQEEERSRIGRELHDHVSQRLGLLAINIDQLRMHPSTAEIAPALADVRQQTSEITSDIHSLSHRLHSSMLDHLGIVPALQRLVTECADRYAIPIAFTHTPLPAPVASDVALCLFRVAEEGLANIAKHSQARAARVDVKSDDGGVRLTVADEGVGFDPTRLETKPGLGFVSMRERLRLVHGTIQVRSVPAQGTTLDVWVPRRHRAS